ncbi:MAG: phosphoesterase [Gemmataceae bacterium]
MTPSEQVLVIPAAHWLAQGAFQGFRPIADGPQLLDASQYQFHPRAAMETDTRFKQLIPYVLLRHGNNLFHYRRGGGQETRLEAKRSVGIGGHISDSDRHAIDPYRAGMLRELHEEVLLESPYTETLLGFINDDSSPVGQVHLGVVHLFTLTFPYVTPREAGIAAASFAPLDRLWAEREEFESWSVFAMAKLRSMNLEEVQ